jgi:steroid delta-isomerase-like uncharacterized protein
MMGVGKDLWYQFEALYNKHDWGGVPALFTSDGVHIDPTGRHGGSEAIRDYLETTDKAVPDASIQASLAIDDGDIVVTEWSFQGTHTGPIDLPDGTEIAATGNTLEFPGVSVLTIRDGKIANFRDYFDLVTMMTQLGLMPGP